MMGNMYGGAPGAPGPNDPPGGQNPAAPLMGGMNMGNLLEMWVF